MRVLLPDGDERSTLATARSCLAAGHEVLVPRTPSATLTGVARGVRRTAPVGDPLADPMGFAQGVTRATEQSRVDAVIPVTDPSVEALLRHRALLPPSVLLPFPGTATWFAGTDKVHLLSLAEGAGLAVPEAVTIATPGGRSVLPGAPFFPAVVKPHRSVGATNGLSAPVRKLGVVRVRDLAECRGVLDGLPASAYPVLLQREVHGPGEGLFLLRWGDRIVAAFAHRRLREKPPWGGVSVYRESIALPAELLEAGTELLHRLQWQGVAMIECKRELATGRHVLMELNGRLWGSLQLAVDAGVDFPRLLLACAAGERPAPVLSYRIGVRSRWFWGEVDHLYLRLRHGPARGEAIGAFFTHRPGRDREEIFRWNDPAPFLLESLRRLRGAT